MTSGSTHLLTWVPRDIKGRFGACARAQGISESALLKRLVIASCRRLTCPCGECRGAPAALRLKVSRIGLLEAPAHPGGGRVQVVSRNDIAQVTISSGSVTANAPFDPSRQESPQSYCRSSTRLEPPEFKGTICGSLNLQQPPSAISALQDR
jgi:hypothetical protein